MRVAVTLCLVFFDVLLVLGVQNCIDRLMLLGLLLKLLDFFFELVVGLLRQVNILV